MVTSEDKEPIIGFAATLPHDSFMYVTTEVTSDWLVRTRTFTEVATINRRGLVACFQVRHKPHRLSLRPSAECSSSRLAATPRPSDPRCACNEVAADLPTHFVRPPVCLCLLWWPAAGLARWAAPDGHDRQHALRHQGRGHGGVPLLRGPPEQVRTTLPPTRNPRPPAPPAVLARMSMNRRPHPLPSRRCVPRIMAPHKDHHHAQPPPPRRTPLAAGGDNPFSGDAGIAMVHVRSLSPRHTAQPCPPPRARTQPLRHLAGAPRPRAYHSL